MRISEIMTDNVRVVRPEQTIQEAARIMAQIDAGSLPVTNDGRLVGIITDRDIVVRAVRLALGPSTPVQDVMSENVTHCFSDDDVEAVAQKMAQLQVRRLPVLDRQERLLGIVALGDIATGIIPGPAGLALSGISERGGTHNQTEETVHEGDASSLER